MAWKLRVQDQIVLLTAIWQLSGSSHLVTVAPVDWERTAIPPLTAAALHKPAAWIKCLMIFRVDSNETCHHRDRHAVSDAFRGQGSSGAIVQQYPTLENIALRQAQSGCF